jgi:hypothetical protein
MTVGLWLEGMVFPLQVSAARAAQELKRLSIDFVAMPFERSGVRMRNLMMLFRLWNQTYHFRSIHVCHILTVHV